MGLAWGLPLGGHRKQAGGTGTQTGTQTGTGSLDPARLLAPQPRAELHFTTACEDDSVRLRDFRKLSKIKGGKGPFLSDTKAEALSPRGSRPLLRAQPRSSLRPGPPLLARGTFADREQRP